MELPTNLLTVHREGCTNNFLIGESNLLYGKNLENSRIYLKKEYNKEFPENREIDAQFNLFLEKAERKNPNLSFPRRKIYENVNEDGTSKFYTKHGAVNPSDVDMEIQESEEKIPEKQKVGTLMVKFDIPSWEFILNKIKDVDLYHPEELQYGKEEEPHITVLYGFNETVTPEDIRAEIGDFDLPIKAKILGISLFNNPEFDVVKLDIESPQLVELRRRVEQLPNTLTYTDYKPHMTIAYAIRGRGQKYVHRFKTPIEIQSDKIVFSDKDRNKIKLDFSSEIININEGIMTKSQLSEIVKEYMVNEGNILSLKDLPFKDDIERLGGQIFSVGGAVRDEFLGKDSKDLDILITGVPMDKIQQIAGRYGKVDAVGESFGVLKFVPTGSKDDVDIAIPRTEKLKSKKSLEQEYQEKTMDLRKQLEITKDPKEFTKITNKINKISNELANAHKAFDVTSDHTLPIEKDLIRRDFTINAIAKDINGQVIDPYGGVEDLKNKTIRVVNPKAFGEDPLRMLRAVQFASRFDFEIEPKTMKLIQKNAPKIKEIASERILIEFDKIVRKGDAWVGVQLLKETGLFKELFGQTIGHNKALPWERVNTMGEFIYLMLKDVTDTPSELFKTEMKGDIDTYKEIKGLETGFNQVTDDDVKNRLVVHNMYTISPASTNSGIIPRVLEPAINDVIRGKYPKNLKELAVNGNDLMNLGLKGKEIGDTLKSMLIQVYIDKVDNNREDLLATIEGRSEGINEVLIDEAYSMIESLLSEREIRYMPNAETVSVNKNCQLGGKGDGTSDACNQGEMKNLTTKKIDEEEEEVNSKRPYYLKGEEPVRVNESIPPFVIIDDNKRNDLEKLWKVLDDETKEKYKFVYFNAIDKGQLKNDQYYPLFNLMKQHGILKFDGTDKIDISKKLVYYGDLWKNIGDNKKDEYIRNLFNKAQKEGELSQKEYNELDYFLRKGETQYKGGQLSKKH
jgi:tRNA nucleotidyltransferase/poly(A) polymerase/2'-5' RNA ligase